MASNVIAFVRNAVPPKLPNRQKYFRHSVNSACKGGLESIFHQVSKQILKDNSSLLFSGGKSFLYTICDNETPRHGKWLDAFICNDNESYIVEVFFWHQIEQSTLGAYLENGQKVIKIG